MERSKPTNYCFPAVLTFEDGYEIAVTFPDLPGCTTCGETEVDALKQATEALGGHLWSMEENHEEIPAPTPLQDVEHDENESVILVNVYMPSVRLAEVNRAVNRTVTLPAWLNAMAQEKKINFSQILQDALRAQLNC
ncbi:MAG: type II toxin-antitoxin system HicB family antitoxin [Clostridia bacterium]|nr:type II toxin-antitoxin system HicB family antitoxin [Clostridia bacterium]